MKYEITNDSLTLHDTSGNSCVLYRIRALKDFGNVKAGDLGGFVEHKNNLS